MFTGIGLVAADDAGLGVNLASAEEFVRERRWECGGGQKRELADLHDSSRLGYDTWDWGFDVESGGSG